MLLTGFLVSLLVVGVCRALVGGAVFRFVLRDVPPLGPVALAQDLPVAQVRDGGVVGPAAGFVESTRQTLGLRTVDLLARIELLEGRLRELAGPALQPDTS